MAEIFYKLTLLLFFCVFIVIRLYYSKKYLAEEEELLSSYPIIVKVMAAISSLSIIGLALVYVFTDFLIDFSMHIPDEIRLLGIIGYFGTDIAMWLVLHELGVNFSQMGNERSIVSSGPYRYIRHPMYVVFISWGLSTALIASNWLVSLGVPFMILFILLRAPIEEKALLDEFGEEYIQYMKSTSRFFPQFRKRE